MSDLVYTEGSFNIYRVRNGFVVHNTAKSFENGHTHLGKFSSCKSAIYFTKKGIVPRKATSVYFLTSLKRLTGDIVYAKEIEDHIDKMMCKTPKYINKVWRK